MNVSSFVLEIGGSLRTMDTKILETFLLVAELGGLTSAASVLGVPQSQVSRRIKELEQQCGTALLYRHGRGVRLTLAGETLHESLRPVVRQLRDVLASAGAQEREPSGPVSVALSPSFMRAAGLLLLDAMAEQYPQVRVRLVSGYSRYLYEWVVHSQVDVAVLSDAGMSAQLVLEEMGSSPVVLYAHPSMSQFVASPASLDLSDVPLVLPSPSQGLRRHIDLWAAKQGITLTPAYEIDDNDMTKELVGSARAVAIMSRLSIRRELTAGLFVERRLGPDFTVRTVMATARNRPISSAMKAITKVLKHIGTEVLEGVSLHGENSAGDNNIGEAGQLD